MNPIENGFFTVGLVSLSGEAFREDMMKRFLLLDALVGLAVATGAGVVIGLAVGTSRSESRSSEATRSSLPADTEDITTFGAATSGTAAQNAIAIGKAVASAASKGAAIYIPHGTFSTNSLSITVRVQFAPGASILQPARGQKIILTEALTIDTSKHFDNALPGQGEVSFAGNSSLPGVYPQWWGAKGDGKTESGPSIMAAVTAGVTAQTPVLFPSGTYTYATCPNFGFDGLVAQALGKVVFKHTGTGHALKIVEPSAAGIYNLQILGNFIVEGNAQTHPEGVLIESVHHSKIRLNGNGAPGAMFTVKWAVLSEFDLIVSVNDSAFTVTPATGVVIKAGHDYTADSRFNLTIEGVSGIGIDVQHASGCAFTGVSESNGTGLRDNAACLRNTYNNVWFEGNKVADAVLYGKDSVFTNVHSQSFTDENFNLVTAQNTKFIGGMIRKLNLQAGSADTLLLGVTLPDHVALGIVGVGTHKRVGCVKVNGDYVKTGSYADLP
jgi:hypothetical protein